MSRMYKINHWYSIGWFCTGSWVTISHKLVNLRYGNWIPTSISMLEAVVLTFMRRIQGTKLVPVVLIVHNKYRSLMFKHHYYGFNRKIYISMYWCFSRALFQRSLSDGNILVDDSSAIENGGKNEESEHLYPEETEDSGRKGLSESSPEISTCDSDSSYPRFDLIFFP